MITDNLIDYWPLYNNLDNFISNKNPLQPYNGTVIFKENGAYFEGEVALKTTDNYNFLSNTDFTIGIELKNIVKYKADIGGILVLGNGGSGVGGACFGLSFVEDNSFILWTGLGDSDNQYIGVLNNDQYNKIFITYNKTTQIIKGFLNGNKVFEKTGISIKDTEFCIGGLLNSYSHPWFGFANGYYRNIAIYNKELSEEEIITFQYREPISNYVKQHVYNIIKNNKLFQKYCVPYEEEQL